MGWVEEGVDSAAQDLVSGEYAVVLGWAYDALDAQRQSDQIAYITPGEGTILWVDSFVIPAVSAQQALAEQFFDFFLRPDISALVTNELVIATANEVSWPLVKPEFRNSEVIFPSLATLQRAELELPLDPVTQATYDNIWNVFRAAQP